MINQSNLKEKLSELKASSFPEDLKLLHEYTLECSINGTSWLAYEDPDIKLMIDQYFIKLNEFVSKAPADNKKEVVSRKESVIRKQETKPVKRRVVKKEKPVPVEEDDFTLVERIPEEIKFIKRYLALHEKKKTKDDLLRFINALHRSIIEKRIRKSSSYASLIEYIQNQLVAKYHSMKKAETLRLSPQTIAKMKEAVAQEKIMPSVQLIKRYISMNGKYGMKEKAKGLMSALERAWDKGKVLKSDKYKDVLQRMFSNLKKYTGSKSQKILSIEQTELNGLSGILSEYGGDVSGLDGLSDAKIISLKKPTNQVMNSVDFARMRFNSLGFKGKYLKFIGDPSKGFTAMVFGKPKMGKSFLCVDWAGYLARNHGKVLYIAKEEGLDRTLQDKLTATDVAHHNLDVTGEIPENLDEYHFVFVDSVNKLGLTASDLEALKSCNPDTSFIYIFQTTKEGKFKGANEFQHNVDIVIEVPEKGKAIQFGRFNQGGELDIFHEKEAA